MREMTADELVAFYDNLSALVNSGKEKEAREYVTAHISQLPESVRGAILARSFIDAIADEVRENKAILKIQEEGIAAVRRLKVRKNEVGKQDSV